MIKSTSAPYIIPIPATSTGLICPVGVCSHKHPGGFPFLSTSHKFSISSLTFYEWFVTEKSFGWWPNSLGDHEPSPLTWTNWTDAGDCLQSTSEATLRGNDNTPFQCSFVHHVSFENESCLNFSSKVTARSPIQPEPFELRIEFSFQDKSLTEADATIQFFFAGPSPPSQTLKREVVGALQKMGVRWVKFAEDRINRITNGEDLDKPPAASSSKSESPNCKHPTASSITQSPSFKSFWPIVLLMALLVMIVPTISLLFFRIHSMSGSLERHQIMAKEIGDQIEEIRALISQKT
mmetsp:Transcript_18935/g.29699  ORF Transcript_18935/g.29699 Transcript_18935/m.29699 type:complete len:293 (-) Transcript_18935:212-1090(-)|eukprot:CAMPEP_0201509554 /NCGR_PEP_ID=MMETSP0161_2-20130828/2576_1 /ASSEMBLY_ACC=CAM_ASM_000251 /TAXON_ID=180227 /ORGANISM="Neoparamoeba aestuarina, Strain SoJaBio B1-5/56/2" /LENGTH=292 /DNA_ID=CAMNT_0047904541 /DNA_START=24 /DNA_END=902 /DNA_ORIENTATION=-